MHLSKVDATDELALGPCFTPSRGPGRPSWFKEWDIWAHGSLVWGVWACSVYDCATPVLQLSCVGLQNGDGMSLVDQEGAADSGCRWTICCFQWRQQKIHLWSSSIPSNLERSSIWPRADHLPYLQKATDVFWTTGDMVTHSMAPHKLLLTPQNYNLESWLVNTWFTSITAWS